MDDSRFASFSSHPPCVVSFIGLGYCMYKLHTIHTDVNKLLSSHAPPSDSATSRPDQASTTDNVATDTCSGWWPVGKAGKAESEKM